jgi:alpha-1,2-mannosyltransferase
VLVLVNLAAIAFYLLSFRHGIGFGPHREDLGVYRAGGRVWLNGGDLYRQPVTASGMLRLPFTYPPIAAIVLSPFSLVPRVVAVTVLTLVSIVMLAIVLRAFLRRLPGPAGGTLSSLAWLMPVALFIEPVRSALSLGQVEIVLMALVSLDCLAEKPRWPRGALVGVAAAIKLTPLAFVLFFLLKRDYKAVGTMAVSFAAATGIGFLLAWHDSVRFWSSVVFNLSRTGQVDYAGNQSVQAVIARAGLNPQTTGGVLAWLAVSAVVGAAAWLGMRKALANDQVYWALSLNAFAALLISPISWSHHWVWCAPAILILLIAGFRLPSRMVLAAGFCGLALFAASPQWWFPSGMDRELRWAIWQKVIGSSYVIFGALTLALAADGFLIHASRRSAADDASGLDDDANAALAPQGRHLAAEA